MRGLIIVVQLNNRQGKVKLLANKISRTFLLASFLLLKGVYMNRDFKGVWIPKDILHNTNLNITEKCYLALYQQYDRDTVYVENIMQINISKASVLRVRNKLQCLNLINTPYTSNAKEAKKIVIDNIGKGEVCDWCGNKNLILHTHHYPIPKSKNGTNTVKICPNCHTNFHYIFRGEQL